MATPAQDWLLSRKWGVFFHYLEHLQNAEDNFHNTNGAKTDWNTCTEQLDVERIARQLHEINAGFVGFTLTQCSCHLCAPSKALDTLIGCAPEDSPASRRDVIADLSDALSRYDIPLFLYYTGDGPRDDPHAMTALSGDPKNIESGKKQVNPQFIANWSAIMRELSLRYGKKVSGWWVDGLYGPIGYDFERMRPFKDAARAGNPESLFAANHYGCFEVGTEKSVDIPGAGKTIFADFFHRIPNPTPLDDYTAGELDCLDAFPARRMMDGAQSFIFSFLGIPEYPVQLYDGWGAKGCKYSPAYLNRYVRQVNDLGGVVMLDACLYRDGHMDADQLQALAALKDLR